MQKWHRHPRNDSIEDSPVAKDGGEKLEEALSADDCDLVAMLGFSEHQQS